MHFFSTQCITIILSKILMTVKVAHISGIMHYYYYTAGYYAFTIIVVRNKYEFTGKENHAEVISIEDYL